MTLWFWFHISGCITDFLLQLLAKFVNVCVRLLKFPAMLYLIKRSPFFIWILSLNLRVFSLYSKIFKIQQLFIKCDFRPISIDMHRGIWSRRFPVIFNKKFPRFFYNFCHLIFKVFFALYSKIFKNQTTFVKFIPIGNNPKDVPKKNCSVAKQKQQHPAGDYVMGSNV